MTRRCSHCGHNGHNSRTCPERGVRLFGVRLAESSGMRKSLSMGNLNPDSSNNLALSNTPEHSENGGGNAQDGYLSDGSGPASNAPRERKKGIPWTEEEHRMFLLGLHKLGKGDWRGISRNFVQTRTPTQVASHAQKYFIRQNNLNKRKRRSSLFDIGADGVNVGMGRSMSTPSLPTLAEEATSPLHSQSSGSQGSLYSPPVNYDLNRSQSYPSALPGAQPGVPPYGLPSVMSGNSGSIGAHHLTHQGSSSSLDVMGERPPLLPALRSGVDHPMMGMFGPGRAMALQKMSMGVGVGLGLNSVEQAGRQDGRGDRSMGPPASREVEMRDTVQEEHQPEDARVRKTREEHGEDNHDRLALSRARTDPAVSHRLGHEMMLRLTGQAMQRMSDEKAGLKGEEAAREVDMREHGTNVEEDKQGDHDLDRLERGPRFGGGLYWGMDPYGKTPIRKHFSEGEDMLGHSDLEGKMLSGGPPWSSSSYPWPPPPYPGTGFFMGPAGPSPFGPFPPYHWPSYGPYGAPQYGYPTLGGPSLGMLGSAFSSPKVQPTQPKVLRPTASIPTTPLKFGDVHGAESEEKPSLSGLGPSSLTVRLLEGSSSRQSAFQSRASFSNGDISPSSQTDVGHAPISVV